MLLHSGNVVGAWLVSVQGPDSDIDHALLSTANAVDLVRGEWDVDDANV